MHSENQKKSNKGKKKGKGEVHELTRLYVCEALGGVKSVALTMLGYCTNLELLEPNLNF